MTRASLFRTVFALVALLVVLTARQDCRAEEEPCEPTIGDVEQAATAEAVQDLDGVPQLSLIASVVVPQPIVYGDFLNAEAKFLTDDRLLIWCPGATFIYDIPTAQVLRVHARQSDCVAVVPGDALRILMSDAVRVKLEVGEEIPAGPAFVRIWDVGDDRSIWSQTRFSRRMLSEEKTICWSTTAMAISPDSSTLAAGCHGGEICLWDVKTGTRQWLFRNSVQFVRIETGRPGFTRRVPKPGQDYYSSIEGLQFSSDGTTLAVAEAGGVHVWDVESRTCKRSIRPREQVFMTFAFARSRKEIVVVAYGADSHEDMPSQVVIWDLVTGTRKSPQSVRKQDRNREHQEALQLFSPTQFDRTVTSVAYDQRRSRIATGSRAGPVILWNSKTGNPVATAGQFSTKLSESAQPFADSEFFRQSVIRLAISPSGTRLAASRLYDDRVYVWDLSEL